MTTPFPFTQGQVLTAAQMNAITELVVNDKTASYTLVAGDAGERVIMNSASATTITVNTSIFTAGQVIYVTNKGAGVCTITAGTATVSTTGTLALAQFASGVLYCISAGVFIFEAYGVAASASALTLVSAQTFTAVASVSMASGTFSATFKNYYVALNITASSTSQNVSMRVNASGSPVTSGDYTGGFMTVTDVGALSNFSGQGASSMPFINVTNTAFSVFEVGNPVNSAIRTDIIGRSSGNAASTSRAGAAGGFAFNAAGGHDGLTFFVAGTITGTIRTYGLADS